MVKGKKKIVWLASYPKSGNTWFRVFLSNLLYPDEGPVHINKLKESNMAASREMFEYYSGLPSEDLTHDEIDAFRPDVYRAMARESDDLFFLKVHDAYTCLSDEKLLFPADVSHGVIYFVRNPLDIAVSFAHHSANKPEEMIEILNSREASFCGKIHLLYNQLRQKLGSWSQHVKSWTAQNNIPVHVMRYEDMKADTYQSFSEAVYFLGIDAGVSEIQKAIEYSQFELLEQQEKEEGFHERMIKASSFFRKGSIGEGSQFFSEDIINEIVENHKEVLQRFGYLSNKNQYLY